MPGAVIASVAPLSPASHADVRVGDHLLAVNGRAPTDIIEYQQLVDGEDVELTVERDGVELRARIHKAAGERLGLSIDTAVFDRIRTCDNHCTFCFIYQLPKGLRRSLYVKDDDYRLSFLYGNYTTLTRFTEFDLERVVDERLSPLYVSIHTTDPELRAEMLRNPRGATSLRWLRALLDHDIEVHGQVVVCPGVNDGDALERTLVDVLTSYPELASLSVVPIGISAFSTESEMRAHTREEAIAAIDLVERYARVADAVGSRTMLAASDEYYLVAGRTPPTAEELSTLAYAENGVGLVAAFRESFFGRHEMDDLGSGFFQSVDGAPAFGYRAARTTAPAVPTAGAPTVLTGEYAAPLLRALLDEGGFSAVEVVSVVNDYFGGNIKVAGLLTGPDLAATMNRLGPRRYLLADVCLNEGRFLDGSGLADLPYPATVVATNGAALRRELEETA